MWGSFLQEESLTQEMTAVGVGRSLRDVDSDRGAETYDYVRAQELEAERRAHRDREERDREEKGLDEDLKQYWTSKNDNDEMETDERRSEAIQAGRKRSVRDRLGSRQRGGHRSQHRMDSRELDEMSIPPPGKPRSIPDVEQEVN